MGQATELLSTKEVTAGRNHRSTRSVQCRGGGSGPVLPTSDGQVLPLPFSPRDFPATLSQVRATGHTGSLN